MFLKKIVFGSLLALVAHAAHSQAATLQRPSEPSDWKLVGDANWDFTSKGIRANAGKGFLVSPQSYSDFEISLEFRSGKDSNSGIFIRCSDPSNISDTTCYEINIFDNRPDPSGRTGSIVNVAPPKVSINTEGQWNTYEVSAKGDRLIVRLNGVVTVDTQDARLKDGPLALQFAAGEIQFRNIVINTDQNFKRDIVGIWDLTNFELDDGKGNITPWCEGAFGSISYFNGYMSVAINCTSNPEKKLFYSGPYEMDGSIVIHKVRNYSDPSLAQTFRREVRMADQNQLDLVGPLGESGKVIVSWKRR